MIKIEELTRGSIIEYVQSNPLRPHYMSTVRDFVWGITSDENAIDVVELGKFGRNGYIELRDVLGVEITETVLSVGYGFLHINNMQDCITYYRDDFGYIKLDTYGVQHIYIGGKPIKYIHNLQRIFLDYTGKKLEYKKSDLPKKEFRSAIYQEKELSPEEALKKIDSLLERESRVIADDKNFGIKFFGEPSQNT